MSKLKTLNKFEKTHGFQRHKVVYAWICPYFCPKPYNCSSLYTGLCNHFDWMYDTTWINMPKYRYCIDCQMWEFWMDVPEEEWN